MGSWYVFNLGQSCACAPCPGENATVTTVPTAALRGNLGQAPDEKPTVSTESQKLGFKFWSPGVLLIFFVYLFCVFRTRPGDSCLVFVTHDFSSKRSQILRRKLGQEVEELGASRSRPFRGSCLGGCGCTWKQIGLLHLGGLLLHAFTFCKLSKYIQTCGNFKRHPETLYFAKSSNGEELVHVIMCVRTSWQVFARAML